MIYNYFYFREWLYKCVQFDCGKVFVFRYKLMRYMVIYFFQKFYQCVYCEKMFNWKDYLKNYFQIYDFNKMVFGCEECGKKYNIMLGYKRYLVFYVVSSGDFICGVCVLELGSIEVLLDYFKVYVEEKFFSVIKEKKYQCDYCERCFYIWKDV